MKLNYWKFVILGIVILVGMTYCFAWKNKHHSNAVSNQAAAGSDAMPIIVETTKVKTQDIPQEVNSLGSLTAAQIVTISSEVAGRIDKIYFKNGDQVGNNMPIIQLDNSKAAADDEAAVTALQLSRSKLNRAKPLLNQAISAQDFETLKADVESKEAALKTAQAALNQKEIDAPFAGVLGAFNVQEGDYVNAGDPLVTLVNTQELQAVYHISEQYLPTLAEGQLAKIIVNAYPNKTFYGTVDFISPTVDPTTRSIEVHALVDNKQGLLSPGMFIHITQEIGAAKNALVLPESAITADVKGYYVFKVIGNKVLQTYVNIGARSNGLVQILQGLKNGDEIVTAGQQKLEDGRFITVQ